jgi:RNA polymerase sigma factor (sigma-70 family)
MVDEVLRSNFLAMARDPRDIYKGMSDKALLVLSSKGDEMAFDEFYERHKGFILGVCRRHYAATLAGKRGIMEYAEDLRQTTFMHAFRFAASFDGETARPWLCGIARNAFIDILGRNKKNRYVLVHFESDRELDNHQCDKPGEDFKHHFDSPSSTEILLRRNIELATEAIEDCKDEGNIKHFLNSLSDPNVLPNLIVQYVMEAIEKVLSREDQLLIYLVIDWDDKLPSWLKRRLAKRFGIKEASIFNKVKRVKEKIRKYVRFKIDPEDEGKDG